jgi:hypothetical protein
MTSLLFLVAANYDPAFQGCLFYTRIPENVDATEKCRAINRHLLKGGFFIWTGKHFYRYIFPGYANFCYIGVGSHISPKGEIQISKSFTSSNERGDLAGTGRFQPLGPKQMILFKRMDP